jgi:hypothetical protein
MALGDLGAIAGWAGIVTGAIRVTVWGAPVMAATVLVGMVFASAAWMLLSKWLDAIWSHHDRD